MTRFNLTISELEELLERAKFKATQSSRSVLDFDVNSYPNGKKYLRVSQPCAYAECHPTTLKQVNEIKWGG